MLPILKVLGANVRHYRKNAAMSQEELADRAGLHRTYVGGIERGERNVSTENVAKLARALNVEPYQLLMPRSSEASQTPS